MNCQSLHPFLPNPSPKSIVAVPLIQRASAKVDALGGGTPPATGPNNSRQLSSLGAQQVAKLDPDPCSSGRAASFYLSVCLSPDARAIAWTRNGNAFRSRARRRWKSCCECECASFNVPLQQRWARESGGVSRKQMLIRRLAGEAHSMHLDRSFVLRLGELGR
jgi:hypothetical protein